MNKLNQLLLYFMPCSVLSNVPDLDVSSGQLTDELAGGNNTTTANAKLLSDFDTPPVTPDSTPMSIGNSPNFKQQPAFMSSVLNKTVRICLTPPPAVRRLIGMQNCLLMYGVFFCFLFFFSVHSLLQPITKVTDHSSPYRPLNVSSGGQNESADSEIFFEMDGLDGADAPAIGGRYARSNHRSYDADGYDNADEEDDTYGSYFETKIPCVLKQRQLTSILYFHIRQIQIPTSTMM